MRTLLLICLLSFAFSGLAQAQGIDEIPCAAVSLEAFLNRRTESLDLAERMEATSGIDDLVALTAEYIDTVQVMSFSASFCYEGYDTVWRLDQLLQDVYGAQVMRLLGVADEDNTFLQALPVDRQLVDQQAQRLEALLESGERDGLTSTVMGSGGECFYEDMIFPVQQWLAHETLMESVEAMESVADVLKAGSDMRAWRGQTWSAVPACFEAFLHLMELGQWAQFASMQRALIIGGVSAEDDPFAEVIDQMLNPRYGSFGGGFHEERLRVWAKPAPTVIGIATCSLTDIESFAHIPAEFDELLADAQRAVDTAHKLAFIQRQVAWRHRLWLQMPMCREVLEMTWLMRQISSYQATVFALEMISDRDLNSALGALIHANIRDWQRLLQLREHFDAYLAGTNVDLPTTAEAAVFTCGDRLSEEEFTGITAGYRELIGQGGEISSAADAVSFFENELHWRKDYLAGLPGCPEAIELGWWTSLQTTSKALGTVMNLAGLSPVDNPYIVEKELAFERWFKLSQDLRQGKLLPKEQGAPSVGRLRSCSEEDGLTIASAAKTYEELLGYPRAYAIEDMVEFALTYLEWRVVGFRDYPPCAQAHAIRLDYTQVVGDVIARRLLDINGRLYGDNPWRQLPDDFVRVARLSEALFDARLASGPPPDERMTPVCTAEEVEIVAELAGAIVALADAAESLDLLTQLPAFHQEILNWREELMARLPQCAGAVELGWLMNDIHIDLAVLGSLIYVGANTDALPHPHVIEESLKSLSLQTQALGIETLAAPGP